MLQYQININKNGDCVTFDPPVLKAQVGDQIFWTNNDDKPHWPGLPDDKEFFMTNQIAQGSTSSIFSPGAPDTLDYVCSLHPDAEEKGTIVVT